MMKTSMALKSLLGAGALLLPLMVSAESNVQTGTATAAPGATAHVDFSIVIPKILYLRVGTGSAYTSGTLTSANTIDLITFSPAAGTVGNGTAVAGTGGDLTGGVETAAIVSNSGNGLSWQVPAGRRGPRAINNTIYQNTSSGIFADGFGTAYCLISLPHPCL